MALTESTMLELGTTAPDFALTDAVTGKTVAATIFADRRRCWSCSSAPTAPM
jgi:uncharacterized MnhB-related membrane protein